MYLCIFRTYLTQMPHTRHTTVIKGRNLIFLLVFLTFLFHIRVLFASLWRFPPRRGISTCYFCSCRHPGKSREPCKTRVTATLLYSIDVDELLLSAPQSLIFTLSPVTLNLSKHRVLYNVQLHSCTTVAPYPFDVCYKLWLVRCG